MPQFAFRHQIIIGFLVSFLLVAGISFYAYRCIINLEDDKFKVEHTQQVIAAAELVMKDLLDAETGQRGYMITGSTRFLEPYAGSVGKIRPNIDTLHKLTGDNRSQDENIDSLDFYTDKKLNYMAGIIDLYQTQGFDTTRAVMNRQQGKYYMDRCRYYIGRIISQENQLLNQRKIHTVKSIYSSIQAIVIGAILFTAVISVLLYVIRRFFDRQSGYQRQIRQSNAELEKILLANEEKNWVLTGIKKVNEATQSKQTETEMAAHLIRIIGDYTKASFGTFYLFEEQKQVLNFVAGYGISSWDELRKTWPATENWMGLTLEEGRLIELDGPANERIRFETTLLSGHIYKTFIVPFHFHGHLIGVMELAFHQPPQKMRELLTEIALTSGESLHRAQSRSVLQQLFEQTRQQASELESQQEELRSTNEELIYKTEMLQASEEELRVQQDELTMTNTRLASKADELEERNRLIEEARADIALKMQELENSGRYKSEFLANMSHELRTPLNSILVLARILKDNPKNNLNTDQVKYADVIFRSGTDLLNLINDILDLTKIESGKIELEIGDVDPAKVAADMEGLFGEIASRKNIVFKTSISPGLPAVQTDRMRLEQVIKNLLSNAFKFTAENGSVSLGFKEQDGQLHISVQDNGIGIAPEKQQLIFETFQQADGSTSRKYGGTGLGLSISRELISFLGGKISLSSKPDEGSVFTIIMPFTRPGLPEEMHAKEAQQAAPQETQISMPLPAPVSNGHEKPLLLIVEDDEQFAGILSNYAREQGYRTAVLHDGAQVAAKAREIKPRAIILDIMLPGKDGWQILRELKKDVYLAAIPVHMMSAGDVTGRKVTQAGAVSFLKKPVTKEALETLFSAAIPDADYTGKKILLIGHEEGGDVDLLNIFSAQNMAAERAPTGREALKKLQEKEFGCIILDPNLPDFSGTALLDRIKADERSAGIPVIINTSSEPDKDMQQQFVRYADATILKTGKYPERLIDEVSIFLGKLGKPGKKKTSAGTTPDVNGTEPPAPAGREKLKGRHVLLVDDDMRNIFALSSVFQLQDMKVDIAADGMEAIEKVRKNTYDVVLMDMMMPVMDGYEAMRTIRHDERFTRLPIIALTAKAMKDDREKCIEAGASDYMTKPVNMDMLLNLLQIWIR